MLRVIVLFVGVLSVVRATPFDPDSVDRPTPFRYTFRVEKVEFGNNAFSVDSGDENGYEIATFESGENSNFIDDSNEGGSMLGLINLFGDLKDCDLFDAETLPKEGCVHAAYGNVYLMKVLSSVDIEDVYKALEEAGIEECVIEDERLINKEGGSYMLVEEEESVFLIGIDDNDDEASIEVGEFDVIWDMVKYIPKCNETVSENPEDGCALIDNNAIHLVNVLNEDNFEDFEKAMSDLYLHRCLVVEDHNTIDTDPCYYIDFETEIIHFLNLPDKPEGFEEEVSPPSPFQTLEGNGNHQETKRKSILNKQSSVAKKVQAFLPHKVQSRQQPQEVDQKSRRRSHQHGRRGNNGGRVNHRPK